MTDKTPAMTELPDGATVLPDGSAFAIASFPLPANHWLYAPREYRDGEEDPIELPSPILSHQAHGDVVRAAIRYAVRGATMCGKEPDFDPDALVQNAIYALCGPFGGAALQSAQPAAAVSDEPELTSKVVNDACWKFVKVIPHALPGPIWNDLKPAMYAALMHYHRAILALRPQAVHPDTARCIKARNDLNAALHGEGALIDDLEHAVANACAKLLRPQAVPMTRAQRLEVFRKAEDRMAHDINLCWRNALIEETEAHHGITQRADGGEV